MVFITQYSQKNYLGALLIIFGVLFLIFITSGSLFAEYHFIDEHWIISLNHELQGKDFNEASPQQAAGYHKEGHCL
jgi:hypothetical protein